VARVRELLAAYRATATTVVPPEHNSVECRSLVSAPPDSSRPSIADQSPPEHEPRHATKPSAH
jgi:hypothetical protein